MLWQVHWGELVVMSCFGDDEEQEEVLLALKGPWVTNVAVLPAVSFVTI